MLSTLTVKNILEKLKQVAEVYLKLPLWIFKILYTGKLLTNEIVFKKKFRHIFEKYYPVVIQTDMEISNSACIS